MRWELSPRKRSDNAGGQYICVSREPESAIDDLIDDLIQSLELREP